MRVCDILKERDFVLSFEFFPPKKKGDDRAFWDTIEELKRWKPDFVSVTYGAGGSTHDKSIDLALALHNRGFCVVAHLTSISLSRKQVKETLDVLKKGGIENILALRGDMPQDESFVIPEDAFRYAYQLVEFIKAHYDFCVGVAGYPEGHIEAPSREKDIEYLKLKVDKGAEFVITQLFFDNRFFFEFLELAERAGIKVPIIPGIMPITSYNQIVRFTKLCGATIPEKLLSLIESLKDKPDELKKAGIEYTINQCRQLIDAGVRYLHFYTLNKSPATNIILEALGLER
ncbi:MAG: methylenetetrahydrofolate reductase [NAD(P)H] [Deferribacteres bacterium]|nr:methylenetetrahydrofolate reductase [NAD(P)H] [Deferribacteres bacterium]